MDYKNNIQFRKQKLIQLLACIQNNETEIVKALHDDFKKSEFETYLTEIHFVISELKLNIKNIHKWAKPKLVLPSFLNFPSTDYIYKEPFGKVLIISPWNYPFQLALNPSIAAISAGNQVTIKPSELTENTSKIIAKIISETFDEDHVKVVEGGILETELLLGQQRWDYIFFTGSVSVGKIIAKAAAENLTPITLELGGKNPCIIDETANLKLAAKRIVWGKFVNAGQTCIAPDYLLVQQNIKSKFIDYLKEEIHSAYSEKIENSKDYPRIINEKNWKRLLDLLDGEKIIFGGKNNPNDFYIEPTLVDEPSLDSKIMAGEIFGPIVPIIGYNTENELEKIISNYEKPLGFYVFSENKKFAKKQILKYSFGGGCINDTMIQFINHRLPFGGVGQSGIGSYHGKGSFDTFSHHKSVVKRATWLDIPIRYAPYNDKLKKIKFFLKSLH
ncbi:aldehyde dehydrogenase [Flavobacterium sp.]|uniref:aldehyde dehydrogenase n=1 Tax=Flavobacterium sp. TaxID=239 RepID=UPI0022C16361|nr:aldehyde dehydrogenase [Flavobacterium sp.]MCZ8088962.1 aldehyde dehydrogenase [Flavobacterium sp.]